MKVQSFFFLSFLLNTDLSIKNLKYQQMNNFTENVQQILNIDCRMIDVL